jgi:RNA polymerase sigma factor for flagellar operon FliA
MRARLGRRPTVFEMAAELGVGPAKYLHMERRCRAPVTEHDLRAVEKAPSREVPPPDAVHWRQVRDVAMRILDPRERRVLTLYYFEGMRLKDIAVLFGVTQSRVAQIHAEIIAKLRAKLWGSRLDLFCA